MFRSMERLFVIVCIFIVANFVAGFCAELDRKRSLSGRFQRALREHAAQQRIVGLWLDGRFYPCDG